MIQLSDKEIEAWAKNMGISKEDLLFHTDGGKVFSKPDTSKVSSKAVAEANKRRVWTKGSKKKISDYVKNKHATDPVYRESRRNCGEKNGMFGRDRSGENNPRFGVKLSQEIKDKISKAHKKRNAEKKRRQKVLSRSV